jgi:hypothetical protein
MIPAPALEEVVDLLSADVSVHSGRYGSGSRRLLDALSPALGQNLCKMQSLYRVMVRRP